MMILMPKNSPFPGMDPYLESHWGDIHHSIIQYARDQMQEQLPDSFRARVEERVFVEADDHVSRNIFPDVRIIERNGNSHDAEFQSSPEPGGVALAEPLILMLPHESMTEGFIEIRDASSGNRVVTVIEVLSAANKAGVRAPKNIAKSSRKCSAATPTLWRLTCCAGAGA